MTRLGLAALATLMSCAATARAQEVPVPPGGYGVAPERAPDEVDPPAPGALSAPEGYGRVEGLLPTDEALVHVLPIGDAQLRLHLRSRDGRVDPAPCAAPCTLHLTPGLYDLSVQPRGGGPRLADHGPFPFDPGRQAVTLSYDHRSGLRVLGWVFFSLAATTMALTAPWGPIIASVIGAPIAAAFLIPFFPLAFLEDSAHVQVFALPDR